MGSQVVRHKTVNFASVGSIPTPSANLKMIVFFLKIKISYHLQKNQKNDVYRP